MNFLPKDGYGSDKLAFVKHWYDDNRSTAKHFDHRNIRRIPFLVSNFSSNVRNVQHLLGCSDAPQWMVRAGRDHWVAFSHFDEVRRCVVRSHHRKQAVLVLAQGVDPSALRKTGKRVDKVATESTFQAVAEEMVAKLEREQRAPRHRQEAMAARSCLSGIRQSFRGRDYGA